MGLRVTRPITKHGRVYAAGEIIDEPTSSERSLARLFGWEQVEASRPALSSLSKAALVELAEDRGFDTDGLNKSEIRELLEG